MTRKILAICLLAALMLTLFAGCKSDSGIITQEEAQKIVLEDLGVKAGDVEMHVHTATVGDAVCWSIFVTVNGQQLQYIIHSVTGEILSVENANHSH